MFKKKPSKTHPSPAPLTQEEILEDLKTFKNERDSFSATRLVSPNQPNYQQEWWKYFETFLRDVQQMDDLRDQFKDTQTHLQRTKIDLNNTIEELEREMLARRKEVEAVIEGDRN